MRKGSTSEPKIERAIYELITLLHAYLDQPQNPPRQVTHYQLDDPFEPAHRDPGFQQWQLKKRLERSS